MTIIILIITEKKEKKNIEVLCDKRLFVTLVTFVLIMCVKRIVHFQE